MADADASLRCDDIRAAHVELKRELCNEVIRQARAHLLVEQIGL